MAPYSFVYCFILQPVLRVRDLILPEGLQSPILKFSSYLMKKNPKTLLGINERLARRICSRIDCGCLMFNQPSTFRGLSSRSPNAPSSFTSNTRHRPSLLRSQLLQGASRSLGQYYRSSVSERGKSGFQAARETL